MSDDHDPIYTQKRGTAILFVVELVAESMKKRAEQ
jgi:hypothetical protein